MRSKMSSRAGGSSMIYWDSVDSSGSGSSAAGAAGGAGGAGGAGSRNYVDPWDLENYAYLRRHSIAATCSPQPIYQTSQRYGSRLSHPSPLDSDYWYEPAAIREPGYDAPASVEEIYFRPQRRASSSVGCYYHQPIYEDETISHYAAPIPLYAHLSELEQAEALEEARTREMQLRRHSKIARPRTQQRDECLYHRRASQMMPASSRLHLEEEEESVDEVEAVRYREPIKPSHITLNTYGHLKIDYTNSWNSLHRKIICK